MANNIVPKIRELIKRKRTNLCVSVDCTTTKELLHLVEQCGPYVCIIKTHIDIIEDFNYNQTILPLIQLAKKHEFLIFEDRKFADIGNTMKLQYTGGIYRIIEWADLVTCHAIAGEAAVQALRIAANGRERGVLLLAEMSCKGNLIDPKYTQNAIEIAQNNSDICVGLIGQTRTSDMLLLTPGVNLSQDGDNLGQVYRTPKTVMAGGTDIMIVGRGITNAENVAAEAERYAKEGWEARTL